MASYPYLSSDQVLGVPITVSNRGKNQKEVVVKELQEWEVMTFLFGLGFDTTCDNTGNKLELSCAKLSKNWCCLIIGNIGSYVHFRRLSDVYD